jgi:hypothetical protein
MSGTYAGLAPSSVWIWRPSNAIVGETFRTLISEFESGAEQRRNKWDTSRMSVRMTFERATLTIDEVADMWRFYRSKRGMYEPFLLPTYAEITRLTNGYLASTHGLTLTVGQTRDFCTDLRSHFPRFYVENNNGDYDFFHVAAVPTGATVTVSAMGVNSYSAEDVVYPVIKARFAEDLYGVDHLAALLTTVGVTFTEVRS